jgi:hypothetical protein
MARWPGGRREPGARSRRSARIKLSAPCHSRSRLLRWDPRGFEQFRLGVYVQTVQALNELRDAAEVDCALREFVVANAYRTATPDDLLAALDDFSPDAEQTLTARGAHF